MYRVEEVFGSPKEIVQGKSGSKEYRYDCPFCIENRGDPDTKGHLYVNDKLGIYHCYRCGASGRINKSDEKGYSEEELKGRNELLKDLINLVEGPQPTLDIVIPRKKALDDQAARDYLLSRGLSDEMIDLYDIRVGSIFSELLGYVILPNQVKSKVLTDMYCARSFTNRSPKYKNPTQSRSGLSVFNLHRIPQESQQIIICEGAFDAISAGADSVALYGKDCSEVKLSSILLKKPRRVVINLDLDARNKAYELARRIKARDGNLEVKILLIDIEGYKDANDFIKRGEYERYRNLVESAPIYNPLIEGLNDLMSKIKQSSEEV